MLYGNGLDPDPAEYEFIINRHFFFVFFQAGNMEIYCFFNMFDRFFNCLTLREASWKCRYFGPETSFLCLMDQNRVFPGIFPYNHCTNSSSVKPAFLIAALRSPILTVPETGMVRSCPFNIFILIWSPFPGRRIPPAFTNARTASLPLTLWREVTVHHLSYHPDVGDCTSLLVLWDKNVGGCIYFPLLWRILTVTVIFIRKHIPRKVWNTPDNAASEAHTHVIYQILIAPPARKPLLHCPVARYRGKRIAGPSVSKMVIIWVLFCLKNGDSVVFFYDGRWDIILDR